MFLTFLGGLKTSLERGRRGRVIPGRKIHAIVKKTAAWNTLRCLTYGMKPPASTQPLAQLLKKSRELRIRLTTHSNHAARLKESIEQSRQRMARRSFFSPE